MIGENTSGARVCPPEVDASKRVTTKVIDRECVATEQENHLFGATVGSKSPSFREALLNTRGMSDSDEMDMEDWDDEDLPENRWYKENEEEPNNVANFDGTVPIVPVSDEELSN